MSIPLLLIKNFTEVYKDLPTCILYKRNEYLYKVLKKGCHNRGIMINQINYNYEIANEVSKRIILPDKLIDLNIYRMKYIDSFNIDESLNNNIPLDRKINIVNSLYDALKEVHQYLIVGDIAARNCLIPNDPYDSDSYLIDFDLSAPVSSSREAISTYKLKTERGKSISNNKNSDIAKMFVVILELLFQYDIEKEIIKSPNLMVIKKFLERIQNNGLLMEYFNYLNTALENGEQITEYFQIPNSLCFKKEVEDGISKIRKKNI